MFKVEVMVDPKKLSKALLALDGLGYDLRVFPVKNAEPKRGKLIEKGEGSAIDLTRAFLKRHLAEVGASVTMKQIAAGTPATYSACMYAVKVFTKDHVLKRTDRGAYTINSNHLNS